MFGRLRETIRIISYREPTPTIPDVVIMEHVPGTPSKAGTVIARIIESFVVIFAIGFATEFSISHLNNLIPADKHSSAFLTAIAGAVGALMTLILVWIRNDFERQLLGKVHIAELIAPSFGNRLDHTLRVLKTKPRAR
jgi:hypothetical protein